MDQEREKERATPDFRRARMRRTSAAVAPTGNDRRVCMPVVSVLKTIGLGLPIIFGIAVAGITAYFLLPILIDLLEEHPVTHLYCQGHSQDGGAKSFLVVVQQKKATSIRADIRAFNASKLHLETVKQREDLDRWDHVTLKPEYHWEDRNSSVNSILFHAWNGGPDHNKARLRLNRYTGEMKIQEDWDVETYSFEGICLTENDRKF
ncbi:MAG: hypothetical protein J6T45_06785 [Fibrobacterales bacterium]|nr:hypothetical protein [Fibrobacterales bacterium]